MKQFLVNLFFLIVFNCIHAQTQPRLVLPIGHTDWINSAVFSPDGKLALTASNDYTARIFEVASGKELQVFSGHGNKVYSAVFSPDGKLALIASSDRTARIFEVASGNELQVLGGHTKSVISAVFSPDGKLALTASWDSTARIFDIATGNVLLVLSWHTSSVNSAVFSPDGKQVLTASLDSTARVFDVATGKELQVLSGHTDGINSAVFSPDGKLALTASRDKTSRIYEVASGKKLQVLSGHTNGVRSAVFSPDGKLALTAGNDSTSRVFDLATGKELQVLSGHTDGINSAVFSPDGKLLLTSGDCKARIFEVSTGDEMQVLSGHTKFIRSAIFSPDGKLALAASWDHTTRIYEVSSGKELKVFRGHTDYVNSAVFSLDSKLVLTASHDSTARIFEVASGKELQVLRGHKHEIFSAVFSSDGKRALTASHDSTARIYEVASGMELQVIRGHTGPIHSAIFSSDSKLVLTASYDSTARIYEVVSGKELIVIKETSRIRSAVFSPDGKQVLTASYDKNARIYEVATGNILQVLSGHTKYLISAVFSPDGKLALTSGGDNTARIYEVATGKVQLLTGHKNFIRSAVFSPDAKLALTASADHLSILWDVETGKSLYTRIQLEGDNWLVYDQDYRFDGTPGAIDYLYLVCGMEVIDLAQVKDSLYVPGLASKIMNKVQLMRDGNRIPKLSDLNICDLTPLVEPEDEIKKGEYRFRITPRNGGLGATEVYVNGNLTFSFSKEELKQVKSKDQTIYYELSLTQAQLSPFLVSGDSLSFNPIVIKSKIEKGSIYSRGVNVELASTSTNELPRFFGVFIGVDEYGNPEKESGDGRYRNLDYAAKDANDLANAIEVTTGKLFNERTIYRLTGKEHPQPTKDEINATLDSIGKVALANDVLFIFFAGHGDIKKTAEGKSEMRFLTERATVDDKLGFSIADIMEWCKPQNIKAQKRVLVFDACHSGQAVKDFTDLAFSGRGEDEDTRILQLTKLKDKNGMMILAASAANESAYEDHTLQQGVLTYHMLNSIKNDVEKLSPFKDSLLNIRNWFDEVINQVDSYARRNKQAQSPISFGDGRFYIGKITPEIQQSIKVSPQKMRLGKSVFIGVEQAMTWCPDLDKRINAKVSSASGRGFYIYTDREGYYAKGTYRISKKKIIVSYILYRGEERINQGEPITLNSFKITDDPEKVADAVKVSIEAELGKLVIKK